MGHPPYVLLEIEDMTKTCEFWTPYAEAIEEKASICYLCGFLLEETAEKIVVCLSIGTDWKSEDVGGHVVIPIQTVRAITRLVPAGILKTKYWFGQGRGDNS